MPSLPATNKTWVIAVKNYAKADLISQNNIDSNFCWPKFLTPPQILTSKLYLTFYWSWLYSLIIKEKDNKTIKIKTQTNRPTTLLPNFNPWIYQTRRQSYSTQKFSVQLNHRTSKFYEYLFCYLDKFLFLNFPVTLLSYLKLKQKNC